MKIKKILSNIVNDNLGDLKELSEKVLAHIYSQEESEREMIFSTFLRDIDASDFQLPSLDEKTFEDTDEKLRFSDISRMIDRVLQNMNNINVSESVFYNKLWNKFNDEDLFPEHEDKVLLLLAIWLDVRIPYYHLGQSCSMDNDEYKRLIEQSAPELKKARFIIFKNIPQRTQKASLLMSIADSIEDYRQKVVFWSYVFSAVAAKEAVLKMQESPFHKTDVEDKA